MHTEPQPRKIRRSGHRLAIAGAGLLGAAGLAVFAVGGASGAMASTPVVASTNTTVSAEVVTALSITDTTASIDFGNVIPGDTYSEPLTYSVTSNEPNTTFTSANLWSPDGAMLDGGASGGNGITLPASNITVTAGTGSPVTGTVVGNGGPGNFESGQVELYTPLDTVNTAGTGVPTPTTDTWNLSVPAGQAVSTYTGFIAYEVSGS